MMRDSLEKYRCSGDMDSYATLFTHPASLSGVYLNELIGAYENRYGSLTNLIHAEGIDPSRLQNDLQYRIPLYHSFHLLDKVTAQQKDPSITLKVIHQIRPKAFQFMGYAVTSCRTLGDAAQMLSRYERLVWDAGKSALDESGTQAMLSWIPSIPVPNIVVETAIAGWLQIGRTISPIRQPVTKVTFQHKDDRKVDAYRSLFQCPVEFGAAYNAIYFPKSWLRLHPVDEDPVLQNWVTEQAEKRLNHYRIEVNLECELRSWMLTHLDDPTLSLDTAAQFLDLSPRQLRHSLTQHNINFRHLLDQSRQEMAMYLIHQQIKPLSHIALACGFSEQSAFNRAFRRWTNTKPSDYYP